MNFEISTFADRYLWKGKS